MMRIHCRRGLPDAFAAVSVAILVFVTGVPDASAQQPVQRVEVTGSAVKRIEAEGALPVQSFNRADIERTGATSVADLIQKLPLSQNFTPTTDSVGFGGGGFSSASVHNMGSERTLVLLNGRRIASFGGQTILGQQVGIDLNTIPLAAIERVDILTDGASALYGSDAIGGVVNFILRSNSVQGDATIALDSPKNGVAKQKRFSITKGFGDLQNDGFNVLLSYSRENQDELKATDRSFSSTGLIPFTQGGQQYTYGAGSARSVPANFFSDNASGNPAFPNCPRQHFQYAPSSLCLFDYGSTVSPIPESERNSFLASFNFKLGSDHTLFGDVMYSNFKLTSRIAPAPGELTLDATSPWFGTVLAADPAATAASVFFRNSEIGNRVTRDETTATHVVLGAKGVASGWDYQTSLTHSVNYWTESYTSGWMKNNGTVNTLSTVFDPFLPVGGNSPAALAQLQAQQFTGEFKKGTSTLDFFELRGARDAFQAPGGTAQVAAGLNVQYEKYDYRPSGIAQGLVAVGDTIWGDQSADVAFKVSRRVVGLFGELLVPLSKRLEMTGSLRHDAYSDLGGTTNYKVSARFIPTDQILIRGSVGTGFRAPTPTQMASISQLYGVTGGSHACPTGIALPAPGPAGCAAAIQWQQVAQGNPDLKPEKSEQFTVGMRYEPNRNFTGGMDFWQVKIKDQIDSVSEGTIFGDPVAFARYFVPFFNAGTGATESGMAVRNDNFGNALKRGIDFDVRLGYGTSIGTLSHQFFATYMLKDDYTIPGVNRSSSSLGKFGENNKVTFRWQTRLVNTLQYGAWAHALTFNYKSGYTDQPQLAADCFVTLGDITGPCVDLTRKVDPYWTVDWQTRYNVAKSVTLTAGLLNITDRDPPMSLKTYGSHEVGYDARYTDPRGRTLYGSLKVMF